MTRREIRQFSTLIYFLPRPTGKIRHQGDIFLHAVAHQPHHTFDLNGEAFSAWHYEFDEMSLHEYYGQSGLGILSWQTLKNGKRRYTVDLDKVKQIVKEQIDAGIKSGDEHILASLHNHNYGCYLLPLKRIFPEYKNVMKQFWRRAWLEGWTECDQQHRREMKAQAAASAAPAEEVA